MADLKPCPFCWSTPKHGRYTTHGKKWECRNCGAMGPNHEPNTNKGEHQLWNTRPIEDAKDATIERMRGLLGEIIARHEETRDEVLNDHWGAEFDINGVLDVIDHMCVWGDTRLARIDAEMEGE